MASRPPGSWGEVGVDISPLERVFRRAERRGFFVGDVVLLLL
jgi:hypothetical protein